MRTLCQDSLEYIHVHGCSVPDAWLVDVGGQQQLIVLMPGCCADLHRDWLFTQCRQHVTCMALTMCSEDHRVLKAASYWVHQRHE